jgi:hypothetical protein
VMKTCSPVTMGHACWIMGVTVIDTSTVQGFKLFPPFTHKFGIKFYSEISSYKETEVSLNTY